MLPCQNHAAGLRVVRGKIRWQESCSTGAENVSGARSGGPYFSGLKAARTTISQIDEHKG